MAPRSKPIHKLAYPGAIDADGHVLEPRDVWERYLEQRYKPRAIRIKEDADGTEYMEIGGQPSRFLRGRLLSTIGVMDANRNNPPPLDIKYASEAPLGAMDPRQRLARLDAEGLVAAFLYPTLGLLYETECSDADLVQAYTRAYNRWIADFCADSGGRLVPIAHLSLSDPKAAADELERAVKDGCKGAFVSQFAITRKPIAHPDHDVLFAKAQELGVPFGIHPTFEPPWALPGRFDRQFVRNDYFYLNVTAPDGIRHAFTSFFQYATFDKFPKLKLIVLEAGAGWIRYWLDRMDSVYESVIGRGLGLKQRPSFYFDRNCWISSDPDERSLPAMMALCGEDKFFWASDFPHLDHPGNYLEELEETAEKLAEPARRKLLGENVARVYDCPGLLAIPPDPGENEAAR
jgi:predicted TIM-barrel fold metal-dependent hydrolase